MVLDLAIANIHRQKSILIVEHVLEERSTDLSINTLTLPTALAEENAAAAAAVAVESVRRDIHFTVILIKQLICVHHK